MKKQKIFKYSLFFLAYFLTAPGTGYAQSKLYGGEGISSSSTATAHACSGGFVVEKSDTDEQFLVTAGHCARSLGNPWYDVNQGWSSGINYIGFTDWTAPSQTINEVFVDLALIKLPDDVEHGAQGAVTYDTDYDRSNASNDPLGRGGLRLVVTDIIKEQDLYVGQEVCITGASTGSSCGKITNLRTSPSNSYFTDICLSNGDSGGAVYTVNSDRNGNPVGTAQAVGILRGGKANTCDDNSGEATFTPLGRLAVAFGDEFETPSKRVHITKRNASNYALDGNRGGRNGQNVYLYDASQNNINQQWVEIERGDEYYSYQKFGTSFCIDGGNGGARNQNVFLWSCSDTNHNQQWKKVSTDGGAFQLIKRNALNWALDGGSNGANSQNVKLSESSESSHNLQWFITPIE